MPRPPRNTAAPADGAEAFIGTQDAAQMLGVSVSSIQRMVARGTLQGWRTDGGHRRVSVESLQAVARARGPRAPVSAAAATPPGRRTAPVAGTPRVTVVEDNPLMVRSLQRLLTHYGDTLSVGFVSDAAQALMDMAEHPPSLVITDLVMSPLDGFHLIRMLRGSQRYDQTAIVVVTGLTEEEIAARGGTGPGTTVYRKPVPPERLVGFIDGCFNLGAVRGETIAAV